MTKFELVAEGLNLMFTGMGFVILFLFLLIFTITLMSNVINRFFPEPTITKPIPPEQISPLPSDDIEHLRPVIVATIAHHRRQQGLR